ncbi:MAG: PHP domain-containing protein [Chloroflexi bacterium]|nr:PHP domain-containing protein [Chloroflexota bacterium]
MPELLRADFHIHTVYSPDSCTSPAALVRRCVKMGLGCIAVTDHNTIKGALEVARIAPFRVIIGEEVRTAGGEIIGLFLSEAVPRGLSPLETVKRIKAQGGLIAIPHPFDRVRRSVIRPEALAEVLPQVDIVEGFNARNTFQRANAQALELARQHNLIATAVSDAHHVLEVGRTYTELPPFDGTPAGLREALRAAHLVGRPAGPLVHLISTWNKLRRRLGR